MPDGRVKILELGRAFFDSKYKGYESLHDGQSPIERHVMALIRQCDLQPCQNWWECKGEGYPVYGDSLMGLPKTDRELSGQQLGDISNYDYAYLTAGVSKTLEGISDTAPVVVLDSNPVFRAVCGDKGHLAGLLAPNAPDLFPKQAVYPAHDEQPYIDPARIAMDFGDSNEVVVKAPRLQNGQGVTILDILNLQAAFARQAFWNYTPFAWLRADPFACLKGADYAVVQERVPGMPVDYRGKPYDATMRAIGTVMHNCDRTEIVWHDVYYKLPQASLSARPTNKNVISDVDEGGSCDVPEEHRRIVFDALARLEPAIHPFFCVAPAEIAGEYMDSADPHKALAGLRLALDEKAMGQPAVFPPHLIPLVETTTRRHIDELHPHEISKARNLKFQ